MPAQDHRGRGGIASIPSACNLPALTHGKCGGGSEGMLKGEGAAKGSEELGGSRMGRRMGYSEI